MGAADRAAEGLGRILHDRQAETCSDVRQRGHVGRMAVAMYRDQRPDDRAGFAIDKGLAVNLADCVEMRGERHRIDPEAVRLAVDEVRRGPAVGDCVGGCDEGEGGQQDLVPRLDADGQERGVQCCGPVDGGDGVACAGDLGEHVLEPVHLAADGRYPAGVEAILHVGPGVAVDCGRVQRMRPCVTR